MKAYSKDLREKIVDTIGRGMPNAEAARTLHDPHLRLVNE
jgi:hypothetical protein